MTPEEIKQLDSDARFRFTYLADPATYDNWRSHADDVLSNKDWAGDCDDLGSTVLDLLYRHGLKLGDLYRLIVYTEDSQVLHFVGACQDDDRNWWVVGDTYRPAYPASEFKHIEYQYNRLSEAGPKLTDVTWRQGVPWNANV